MKRITCTASALMLLLSFSSSRTITVTRSAPLGVCCASPDAAPAKETWWRSSLAATAHAIVTRERLTAR